MRRTLIRIIGSTFALCVLVACQSGEEKLAAHLTRGDEYREAEKWEEAIIEYKNVLQIDPNSAAGHYGLSQAFLKAGKVREAFWELRETVRLDASNHEAKLQFAQLSLVAGEFEEALGRAEEVIADDPSNVTAYLVKGQAHDSLKQPDEALAAFEKAVEVDPQNRTALLVLGAYLLSRGDRAAAEPYFVRGPEVEPVSEAYLALAGFYAQDPDKTRDVEAEAAYKKAIGLAEGAEIGRGYQMLGAFYFVRDRFELSVATIEEGIEKADNPLDLIYQLARMYREKGDDAKADELAVRATVVRPEDPRPQLVLSAHLGRKGDFAGALTAAERAVELAPDDDQARLRKAEVLIELGFREENPAQVAEGREIAEAVLAEEPSNAGALFVIAKLHLAERKPQEAIQALRGAIDVKPDWAEAHFLLGTALAAGGERTAARTELARALDLDKSLLEARRVLADVHAALGEHEYAIEEGRRYLKVKPDSASTRVRVAQSLMLMRQFDEALKEVQAIDPSQRDVQINYAIGRIYLAKEDHANARKYLLAALEENPTHAEILESLLILDAASGRLDESAARIQAAREASTDDANLERVAGLLALQKGNVGEAEEAFKRALELNPSDIQNYRHLAEFYGKTGRTQETIDVYEKALVVEPNQPQVHHLLGVLYEYGGQSDRAIEHYEEAIRWAPGQAQSKNNLAYIYAETGKNLDRALDLAQEAKAQMPDDPNTADTLGWVLYRRGVPSAAISYLKEAEAGIKPGDSNLGLVRHHLALAYEASGDRERARAAAERAVAAQEAYVEVKKASGEEVVEDPDWYAEALSMRKRL
ncbi:MAG TPA: tetratricopeptide repeat protein [Myxococcota bacterium]